MDTDYAEFEKWYAENERRFYTAQMTEEQIAYSAFLHGLEIGRKNAGSSDVSPKEIDACNDILY
jgi:hypothetical protein